MRLTPWEEERLLIFSAAELARRHRAAGLALNAPEAVALICDAMLEAARAGAYYDAVEDAGRAAVGPREVLDGVRELVDEVRLEVRNDSTRAVRVSSHYPFERVNPRLAFDRAAARGFRLDLPAGDSVHWRPGETKSVDLVRFGGLAGAPEAERP